MTLVTAGYWQTTYWAENYWQQDYWLEYGYVAPPPASRGGAPARKRRRVEPQPFLNPSQLELFREYLRLKLGEANA